MKYHSIVIDLYDIRFSCVGIGEFCFQPGEDIAQRADELKKKHQYTTIKYLFFAKRMYMTIHDINLMYEKKRKPLKKVISQLQRKTNRMDANTNTRAAKPFKRSTPSF